jgi:Fur family ferric uptake transcriptional regulator
MRVPAVFTLGCMELEAVLRAHGCRVTRPRRVVWDVLDAAGEHLSAPTIAARVNDVDPTINSSSVYRALAVFADLGLVRESRFDGVTTWEPFHGDAAIHLQCSRCGRVVHHDTGLVASLRRELERDAGFVPDGIDVGVTGRCARCAGEDQLGG